MGIKIESGNHPLLKKITLSNSYLTATFVNYGARMYELWAPDAHFRQENILLTLDKEDELLTDTSFFGAVVGPVAGRIREGDCHNYSLEKNEKNHHIHGGSNGWSFQFWSVTTAEGKDFSRVSFSLIDTLSGYPGPIHVTVHYTLEKNQLIMEMDYWAEKQTWINPTSHTYFNLSGNGKRKIQEHFLTVKTKGLLELDKDKLPTGKILTSSKIIPLLLKGVRLSDLFQIIPQGLDDPFILKTLTKNEPNLILSEPLSGRKLEIFTDQPSFVLFSTTDFNSPITVTGQKMRSQLGLAIEPQHLPDILHFPHWGTIEVLPNTRYTRKTIYQFSTLDL